MTYDNAGNLTTDTYTGAGSRVYDGENRMTQAWGGNNQWQEYSYNADGQRTRRKLDGVETWQVYGMDGELLAEYAASAAPASPQKEYGYRNGQLLITASGPRGYWKFDENSGTAAADSSGSGNTGTLSSGAAWGTGQNGSAVSLDGVNDYVQVGAQSSLVMTSAASFSAWIYPTGAGSEPTYGGVIINKEGEYEIVRFPNGTIQWAFANSNPGWNFINSGYVAPLNQWTHVAVTYDNGTIKTYANGTLVHTYNGAGSIGDVYTAQNDFRIGGRQVISQHLQGRIDEVRVYNRALTASEVGTLPGGASSGGLDLNWLVSDQLGTPRMIFDKTGSLANVKRHDYLPFGEELFVAQGLRTTALGYAADSIRQKFTSYERDTESGLDFAQARYHASTQGRFTSPDPLQSSARTTNPQSFNRYAYVSNNPLKSTDPSGMAAQHPGVRAFYERNKDCTSGTEAIAEAEAFYEDQIAGLHDSIVEAEPIDGALETAQPEPQPDPQEPQIVFDSVQLLDDPGAGFPQGPLNVPRPVNPIRSATTDPLRPNEFTLDVDHPAVDTNGILAIRVKFHVIDGGWDSVSVTTTERESRRWRVAGGPMKTEGGIIFHANVYDAEASINLINVTVRTQWTASIWDKGKLNDVRYKSAEAKIILRIGPKDK